MSTLEEVGDATIAEGARNGIRTSDVVALDEDVGDSALAGDGQELRLHLGAASDLQEQARGVSKWDQTKEIV